MHLHQHWADVRRILAAARQTLPAMPLEDPAEGSVERYENYLENNELELALDELEGLGNINGGSPKFWEALRSAAEKMKLSEHAGRYAKRLGA